YMPEGVALAVVDPTVGTERRGIAAQTPWGYLVGPDNGLLAPAVQMTGGASLIVSLEEAKYQLPRDGVTFDGRDIFAPAAALLAAGEVEISDLGPEVETGSAVPLMLPLVDDSDGILRGEVLWVDGFGNAQTNITPEDMAAVGLKLGATVEVAVGASKYLVDWRSSYGDVEPGEGVVHIDSYGQIAVAVREGSASADFNLTASSSVVISSPQ
ncbi:MAG: SAM-dependent chlorinase/fluorinase, partial [Acidimicrobiia bacterium]|nr:SAM-dependent chlorinase/fluorinase [Acidimicrobiia bacterium]